MKVLIRLPANRDRAGWLEVLDDQGARLLGPAQAAGRAHGALAALKGNAARDPLLPYGDTPTGDYIVAGVFETGAAGLDPAVWGAEPVVLLEPIGGQAALADAHGRFRHFIQGGETLTATAGGVRLMAPDQRRLATLLGAAVGPIRCEIVDAQTDAGAVDGGPVPAAADPPPSPARPRLPISEPEIPAFATSRPFFASPRLFLVPETSGSGGPTIYGDPGSGGDPGGGGTPSGGDPGAPGSPGGAASGDGPNETPIGPLPVTGVDVAPTPGADLNPASQPTPMPLDTPGASQMSGGLPTDSAFSGPGNSLASFTGNPTASSDPDAAYYPNASTGTTGYFQPDMGVHAASPDEIASMVSRFAQSDAMINAGFQQDPATGQWVPAQAPSDTDASSGPTPLTAPPPIGAGAIGNSLGGSSGGAPLATGSPPRIESTGAWSRANPSPAALDAIQNAASMGFLDPSLTGVNVSTATGQTEASINRLIRGQTAEIMSYDARLAQGEIGILAPKGASLAGLDYATASQLPNGDYQINVGDTASRFTQNPFKTSPGAAKPSWQQAIDDAFGPNGSFNLPNNPAIEQGIRDAHTAGRISNVQIDTVDFSPQGQGSMTVDGRPVSYSEPGSPGRSGGGGALGNMGLGAGIGGGMSAGMQLADMLLSSQSYTPGQYLDAGLRAGGSGAVGGATGSAIETAFVSQIGREAAASTFGTVARGALSGGPAAVVATFTQMALSDQSYSAEDYEAKGARSLMAGTFAGVAAAEGPALVAAVAGSEFGIASAAAIGTALGIEGGGVMAAALAGGLAGSEVPILGTLIGAAIGIGVYYAADALFGDDVEQGVRDLNRPSNATR